MKERKSPEPPSEQLKSQESFDKLQHRLATQSNVVSMFMKVRIRSLKIVGTSEFKERGSGTLAAED